MISSCILLFYFQISGAAQPASASPDALYAARANLASAKQAADLWKAELARDAASPAAFDVGWKLARAQYWLGGHAPEAERRAAYEAGMDAARTAIKLQPNKPEGHFWLAANMGAMAESFGVRQGIKYRKPIRESLETVLRLNPAFQQGSADRALGRWYFKVPRLFGGSNKDAEAHLRASLQYNPTSTATHFFLAEVLLDGDRRDEGRAELQKVLDAPLDPDWTPEDQEFKEKARALLAKK